MSRDNVETIARLYAEHLSAPERIMDAGIVKFFDADVVIEQEDAFLGTQGTFRGYDGLVRSANEMFELFRDVHFIPEELIDVDDDRVMGMVVAHMRGKESGVAMREPVAHLWTLRDDRVVAWRVFLDRDEALAAVGLSKPGD